MNAFVAFRGLFSLLTNGSNLYYNDRSLLSIELALGEKNELEMSEEYIHIGRCTDTSVMYTSLISNDPINRVRWDGRRLCTVSFLLHYHIIFFDRPDT